MVEAAKDQQMRPFVIHVIEEMPSDGALLAALAIGRAEIDAEAGDLGEPMQIVGLLNTFGHKKIVDSNTARIRGFLHRLLLKADDEVMLGTVVCALRWYGDEDSLKILRTVPVMSDHWEAARRAAIRIITRRIK